MEAPRTGDSRPTQGRICSECGEAKAPSAFYAKGERLDTRCKDCKKAYRRSTYQSKATDRAYETVCKVLDIVIAHETEKLRRYSERLDEVIKECQMKRPA